MISTKKVKNITKQKMIHLCCLSVLINDYSRGSVLPRSVTDRSLVALVCPKRRLIEEVLCRDWDSNRIGVTMPLFGSPLQVMVTSLYLERD